MEQGEIGFAGGGGMILQETNDERHFSGRARGELQRAALQAGQSELVLKTP